MDRSIFVNIIELLVRSGEVDRGVVGYVGEARKKIPVLIRSINE